MTINEQIAKMQAEIKELKSAVAASSSNTDNAPPPPTTFVGGSRDRSLIQSIDAKSGQGQVRGNQLIWYSGEIDQPLNQEPDNPDTHPGIVSSTKIFNKHTHSRYSGGALLKNSLEIVDYDLSLIDNPHSQIFWKTKPTIKKEKNSQDQSVEKIGLLDLIFNPDTKTWGVSAYEIDVTKCYVVQKDENGIIKKDSKGQDMKSPLWNEDTTKTSVIWDKNGKCWRFLAVYAPTEEV
jgi:hypothetical protein